MAEIVGKAIMRAVRASSLPICRQYTTALTSSSTLKLPYRGQAVNKSKAIAPPAMTGQAYQVKDRNCKMYRSSPKFPESLAVST